MRFPSYKKGEIGIKFSKIVAKQNILLREKHLEKILNRKHKEDKSKFLFK